MSKFENNQFTLQEDGFIAWQEKPNNPTAGVLIAKLVKGTATLSPEIEILPDVDEAEKTTLKLRLQAWLEQHIKTVLEGLVALEDANLEGAAASICKALYEHLGVVPRADLEAEISKLDETAKAQIRSKKVRFGPMLVFLPLLNKPAPIRLRAILWSLWHGMDLPPKIPCDGIVSQIVTDLDINKDLYQMIGYPVMGPRAVRIDMLDRVIVDIYDSSKNWKFQAKSQYSEWTGATTDDMYAILEAMGHKRIVEEADKEASEKTDGEATTGEAEKKPVELSWFELRRGKMSGDPKEKPVFKERQSKPKPKVRPKPKKKGPPKPKNISIEITGKDAVENSSPFAILEQLKDGKKSS